jgi:uncharacterized protein HemX
MTNINDPQLAEEIRESVTKKLSDIKGFTEEQPIELQAQCNSGPIPLLMAEEAKPSNSTGIVVLLALMMFLASGLGIFFIWKKQQVRQVQGPQSSFREGMTLDEMRNTLKPFVDSTNKRLDMLEKRADATDKRIDMISHRQWVLGIAFNNNVSIQKYTSQQINPDLADKIIWLDTDWKLNRVPAFIQLSDDDRRKLMEGIK